MNESDFLICSFYRFFKLKNKEQVKKKLDHFFENKKVKGTILLANEGLNGSISAKSQDLENIINFIKITVNIRKLELKINHTKFLPFNRIKVRLKKEIVSLGIKDLKINTYKHKLIGPKIWNELINEKETKVIDVRNNFEIEIGKFKNSINPKTRSFREFPMMFKKMKLDKNTKIAMYCTGGIRCEKASSFLMSKGYKNIFQLEGGIISYLKNVRENKIKSYWDGDCFVFDERVTINKNLKRGNYSQCFGCRRPITKKDMLSNKYEKGVTCPYCFYERTAMQKRKSKSRQDQIEDAIKNKKRNVFIK